MMNPFTRHLRPSPRRVSTLLGIAIAVGLCATACSGATNGEPPAAAAAAGNPTVPVVSSRPDLGAESTGLESWLQTFVGVEADVITGSAEPAELEAFADGSVVKAVVEERDENARVRAEDRYPAIAELNLWANVTATEQRGGRLIVTGCTERQEQNEIRQVKTEFVTRRYVLDDVGDAEGDKLRVVDIEILHDGWDPTTLGCIPQSFRDRAEAIAQAVVDGVDRSIRDPEAGLDDDTALLLGPDVRGFVDNALAAMVNAGRARATRETQTVRALGLDTLQSGLVVTVAVCRHHPDGVADRSLANGEQLPADLVAGAIVEDTLHVQLDPVPSGFDAYDQVITISPGQTGCDAPS